MKKFLFLALAFALFISCDNDPDNLYGKKKEFRILDEYGSQTTHAYASIISGTYLEIVGGIGTNHVIEVARVGSDIATVPYKIIESMIHHPLTTNGIQRFLDDWAKAEQK